MRRIWLRPSTTRQCRGRESALELEWLQTSGEMAQRIRAFRWDATPLGPVQNWPTLLRTSLSTVLDSPVPMVLIWGRELVMLQNDAYQKMMNPPPEVLGGSYLAAWGPIQEIVRPQIEQAFAGTAVRIERQGFDVHQADGGFERRFFDYSFSPVRDEGGQVVGLVHIGFEITSRERTFKALSTSEARLRAAIHSVPVGVAILDTEGEFVISNEEYRRYLPSGKMPSRDAGRGSRWKAWDENGHLIDPEHYPGARALRGESTAEGMEFLFTDDEGREIWTNVATAPIRDNHGKVTGAASVITDITERKRNAERLSRSAKRSAFLLQLSDALGRLTDVTEIRRTACAMLGKHIGVERAYYVDFTVEAGNGVVDQDFSMPGLASLAGRYPGDAFLAANGHLARGRTWVVNDARKEHRSLARDLQCDVGSWINVPLVKGGEFGALLCLVRTAARPWSDIEIEIAEEVAERLWATLRSARAETALRESESRMKILIDGVPQLIWRSKAGGHWTWASPQWEEQTGLTVAESLGRGWLEAVFAEDRANVLQCWEESARTGQLETEARICMALTAECRWFKIRATPVRIEAGRVTEWLGTMTDIHDLRELQERQSVLVAELQHRTRNLITVVSAISRRTQRKSKCLDDFEQRFGDRLAALSRVQGLLSNLSAGERVTFDELLQSELSAIAAPEDAILLDGPAGIELRSATVQTMALALHELATNATKHGALSSELGQLAVSWSMIEEGEDHRLHVDWRETGVLIDPRRARDENTGYGRELIERALPYQLKARTSFRLERDGVHCTIDAPIAASR